MKLERDLNYDFLAPPRIVFGWGRRAEVATHAATLGTRALVVSGSRSLAAAGVLGEIEAQLRFAKIDVLHVAQISREPEVGDVDEAVGRVVAEGVRAGDFVLAIGGGSAIDLGKAVAAMVANREGASVADYLEGVGRGLKLSRPPLPVLAMPTSAGTGSEATKNAVISSYSPLYKKSLRSDLMVPRVVLVDPELSVSVPPTTTAYTGMDAITQLIESYISCRAKPIAQALCVDGLRRALPALERACRNGADRHAREQMAHAALLSGLALANSGLGLAHGVAAALGVHCRVPHGLACAVMLPPTLRANREVSETQLAELARACLREKNIPAGDSAAAELFIARIEALCGAVCIPRRLGEIGVRREQIAELVPASRGNSMSGNPRETSDAELTVILEGLL